MIKPDMRADWIAGQADGLRPRPTLMKNRTSDNSHLCSLAFGRGKWGVMMAVISPAAGDGDLDTFFGQHPCDRKADPR